MNLKENVAVSNNQVQIRHPISGQPQIVEALGKLTDNDIAAILQATNQLVDPTDSIGTAKRIFWWFWRFLPELMAKKQSQALIFPGHKIIPDCPIHSYNSTVSAIAGAMFPESWQAEQKNEHPYLLIFTFSPVQEFIKASRKFLDFWSGSYLLHYLSVKLCWYIANKYGPDAVITPSLWSQEIIDALIVQEFPIFRESFCTYTNNAPANRFNRKQSTSLTTAGFPNVITALVPGKQAASLLAEELTEQLKKEWTTLGKTVREHIKSQVIQYLGDDNSREELWEAIASELPPNIDVTPYLRDLKKWQQHGCWEWNKLWDAQLNNTWESYWTAIPLGNPEQQLMIDTEEAEYSQWKEAQNAIAPTRFNQSIPTTAEEQSYSTLNVGTWWGNVQAQLGRLIQSVKNTRNWQIPVAPGERSTLSGQFSAVHPSLHYQGQFREGGGLSSGSMNLFWRVMAQVYPGLFNGSEKLNAIELTKRMAWGYGGIAESLGISQQELVDLSLELDRQDSESLGVPIVNNFREVDYEKLIRFPNLTSIAAARLGYENPQLLRKYWLELASLIREQLPAYKHKFGSRTRGRPFHVPKTDARINPSNLKGQDYNGVMFSAKWLAEDLGLQLEEIETLRSLVDQAHRNCNFGEGSPADWWVIVLADGDGMGKYVSGQKLKNYEDYIVPEAVDEQTRNLPSFQELLTKTKKRMGPATHVALNRALLDFSNRLVPYITEHRFCGKVVYSGGDDVMAVLPLADLPDFLRTIRAAWCGDPESSGRI